MKSEGEENTSFNENFLEYVLYAIKYAALLAYFCFSINLQIKDRILHVKCNKLMAPVPNLKLQSIHLICFCMDSYDNTILK